MNRQGMFSKNNIYFIDEDGDDDDDSDKSIEPYGQGMYPNNEIYFVDEDGDDNHSDKSIEPYGQGMYPNNEIYFVDEDGDDNHSDKSIEPFGQGMYPNNEIYFVNEDGDDNHSDKSIEPHGQGMYPNNEIYFVDEDGDDNHSDNSIEPHGQGMYHNNEIYFVDEDGDDYDDEFHLDPPYAPARPLSNRFHQSGNSASPLSEPLCSRNSVRYTRHVSAIYRPPQNIVRTSRNSESSRRKKQCRKAVPTTGKTQINLLFPQQATHREKVEKKTDLEIKLPHIDVQPGGIVNLVFNAETARYKERQPRQRQHKRGTKESKKELSKYPPTPDYWKHFRKAFASFDPLRIFYNVPRLEYVVVDDKTHAAILKLIDKTWRSDIVGQGKDAKNLNHKRICVTKIERIENFDLYRKYSIKRMEFFQSKQNFLSLENTPNSTGPIAMNKYMDPTLMSDIYPKINEHYLFHGTTDTYVDNILKKGLDFRYSSETCMLGRGTYAAESSTKADQYADEPTNRINKNRKMLLIRMLLGNIFVATEPHKYSKPPCRCTKNECVNPNHGHFDSIVGDFKHKLFREFVVYSLDQCLPEYLITYDRVTN